MLSFPDLLINLLRQAQRVAVLTGAGISAESGIPTFRQAQTGLWAQYDPQELATRQAFQSNPQLVWDWYQWRRNLIAQASPNPGHRALASLQTRYAEFSLITQNVDGLHQRAASHSVIELHGNIHQNKCFECDLPSAAQADLQTTAIPTCSTCGGKLRPAVVWFGESLPTAALQTAWHAAQSSEVFFSIGTSALVQPAAALPMVALEHGATLIEINPNPTPLTKHADFTYQGLAGEILPKLWAALA